MIASNMNEDCALYGKGDDIKMVKVQDWINKGYAGYRLVYAAELDKDELRW